MSLKASVTCSEVAPPPTSRKLAGSPPCSLMMSIVDMANPAPFTTIHAPQFHKKILHSSYSTWATQCLIYRNGSCIKIFHSVPELQKWCLQISKFNSKCKKSAYNPAQSAFQQNLFPTYRRLQIILMAGMTAHHCKSVSLNLFKGAETQEKSMTTHQTPQVWTITF